MDLHYKVCFETIALAERFRSMATCVSTKYGAGLIVHMSQEESPTDTLGVLETLVVTLARHHRFHLELHNSIESTKEQKLPKVDLVISQMYYEFALAVAFHAALSPDNPTMQREIANSNGSLADYRATIEAIQATFANAVEIRLDKLAEKLQNVRKPDVEYVH